VKSWLGVESDTDDALLTRLIAAACGWLENSYLYRAIGQADYVKSFNGRGHQVQLLPEYPILQVSSVIVDGAAIPARPSPTTNGYAFDDMAVYLSGYTFRRGFLNVSISWSAGYATVPEEIEQAAIHLVSARYREKDRIGEASKIIQGMQVNFSIKDLPADVVAMLKNYIKVIPV
jgi:hypothetical protein